MCIEESQKRSEKMREVVRLVGGGAVIYHFNKEWYIVEQWLDKEKGFGAPVSGKL